MVVSTLCKSLQVAGSGIYRPMCISRREMRHKPLGFLVLDNSGGASVYSGQFDRGLGRL